jgi:diacylglycerol kinase (ATP)
MVKSNLNLTNSSPAKVKAFLPAANSSFVGTSASDSNGPFSRHLAWQVAPNLLISFKYAWAGVSYAFVTQRNFRIHTLMGVVAVTLGLTLHLATVELAILVLTSALVMVLELLNTALESVVDLAVGQSFHKLAKIAKDCAAGAVLIAAIAALLVASFLILPPLFFKIFSLI